MIRGDWDSELLFGLISMCYCSNNSRPYFPVVLTDRDAKNWIDHQHVFWGGPSFSHPLSILTCFAGKFHLRKAMFFLVCFYSYVCVFALLVAMVLESLSVSLCSTYITLFPERVLGIYKV